MTETPTLGLPLVQAAQAQKHVTVNEAFTRLDALTQMTLKSVGSAAPPPAPGEGEVHAVGATGATGAWTGFEGALALYSNGGWDFVTPVAGWRAWSAEAGAVLTFDGVEWVSGVAAFCSLGAATTHSVVEVDHAIAAGGSSVLTGALPDGALVLGVTARVTSPIGGVASVNLGVSGDATRYGQGLDVQLGASLARIVAAPQAYSGGGAIWCLTLLVARSTERGASGLRCMFCH